MYKLRTKALRKSDFPPSPSNPIFAHYYFDRRYRVVIFLILDDCWPNNLLLTLLYLFDISLELFISRASESLFILLESLFSLFSQLYLSRGSTYILTLLDLPPLLSLLFHLTLLLFILF